MFKIPNKLFESLAINIFVPLLGLNSFVTIVCDLLGIILINAVHLSIRVIAADITDDRLHEGGGSVGGGAGGQRAWSHCLLDWGVEGRVVQDRDRGARV